MKQTALAQPMYSNDPPDFRHPERGLAAMTNAHEIIFQAELNQTIKNRAGVHFTDTGETPFAWANRQGIRSRSYFLYTWMQNGDWYGPERDHESDVYWLRKRFWHKFQANPHWLRPSPFPTRPYTDLTVPACRDWIAGQLLDSGIDCWMFDESHMNNFRRMDTDQVNANLMILEQLHDAGHDIVCNSGWHMENPHASTWTYKAMPFLRGAMSEYWAGYGDGIPDPDNGKWWDLTEDRFLRVQQDWLDAGKDFYLVARWRPNETKYKTYESFAMDYIKPSKSWYVPAIHNYHISNWLKEFRPWLKDPDVIDPPPSIPSTVQIPLQNLPITVLVDETEHVINVTLEGAKR